MTGRADSSVKVDQLIARNRNRIGYAAGNHNNNIITAVESADNTSDGFSELDLQAVENDTLTPFNSTPTKDSAGLFIIANDVSYTAKIQMGNPPRDFNLLMDSGSADLWVGAEECKSQAGGDCVSFAFGLFSLLSACSSLLCFRATMYFLVQNHRLHLKIRNRFLM
jgi:hypothetical protein